MKLTLHVRPTQRKCGLKKKIVSSKARSNPVKCDISPDKFNSHFINITKNLDSNSKNKPDTFLWKGPKSRYVFKFRHTYL